MMYIKRRKVKMTGYDKCIIACWYFCAIIWIGNVSIEVSHHNLSGAIVRCLLVLLYLFLPISRYYELKRKQKL